MRILFADSVDEARLEPLVAAGHECIVEAATTAADMPDRIQGVDVLVVRGTKVTAEAIAASDSLGLIVRAGAGTDNVDTASASAAGIYVCNVPGRNAVAVAELTMGLLLAIDRRIADGVVDLRQGRWNKQTYSKAEGLYGKTLAVVGLGDIGFEVAQRAKSFGLSVTALRKDDRGHSALQRIRSTGIQLVPDMEHLLSSADIVSLHVPGVEDTVGMVDAAFLAKMRQGAVLLNTSRGDVVDEEALIAAMESKGIRAGLDVWADEPNGGSSTFNSKLAQHASVVGSHHIGASTTQAQESVAAGTVEVISAYLAGDVVNCVNLTKGATGASTLSIRHYDEVGVLAQVLQALRRSGHNVQQMQNQVFVGSGAAVASIGIKGIPEQDLLDQLNDIAEVIGVSASPNSPRDRLARRDR